MFVHNDLHVPESSKSVGFRRSLTGKHVHTIRIMTEHTHTPVSKRAIDAKEGEFWKLLISIVLKP
jgi:hypothetical protein